MIDERTAMEVVIESGEPAQTDGSSQPTSDLPSLDRIIELICRDARRDSMRFALRSDVGLDGE